MEIKKIQIMENHNEKSREIAKILKEKLNNEQLQITEDNPDLVIAIGGDGSFLRALKQKEFNTKLYYVGINVGTLGFLQEVKIEQIDLFLQKLKERTLSTKKLAIQNTEIVTKDGIYHVQSLNEIVVRNGSMSVLKVDVNIDGNYLETFVGDGLIIATSVGSTAYNMSLGGSIVYEDFHTLQITPIAALNSKAYHNLLSPIIFPDHKAIELIPKDGNVLLSVDGENVLFENVVKIKTVVNQERLCCLQLKEYNFCEKIRDKFLDQCS